MQRGKPSIVILGVCGLLVALLAACPNPISSSKGGVLAISINNNINARTLLPAIDMIAASFTVSGTGPGGATFSQTTSGAPVTLDGLAFGPWSVTVNALNAAGTVIGSGQAIVAVHTGQTSTVDITVVPLTGNGSLDLTVNWTGPQVENATIQATLTPPAGSATPLNFSVTGNTGTCSSTTIPAGYQTLTLQLLDSGKPVMGAVEVVRIVAGQTTTGSYTFANVNQPGGSVQVNITPAMAEPIPVSISGVPATVSVGGSMAAAASVSDGTANVTYVWYLNGVSVGIGPTYVLGSTVPAGWYRLDVTAYAAAGTRAGSATASFQVNGVFAPGNSFFYAVNYIDNTVSAYDRGSSGLLTPLSIPTFTTGVPKGQGGPECIAATPNGSFLYVANVNPSNSVSAYSIGVDGLLTPLGPPMPSNGSGVFGIAIAPNGSFLYIANYSSNSVSGYSIGSDGRLTPLSTPNFDTAGGVLYGIAITPKGSFLYVTSQHSNIVSGYAIGSGGLLTPLNTPTFATGASPWEIAITPDGSFLYVTNQDSSTVSGFAIGPNGLLTPLSTPVFSTGSSPRGIVVTPNGSFLYVVNDGDGTVSAYAIGSGGLLTPLSIPTFPTGGAPNKITVAPDGSTLYVGNSGSNSVTAYAIGFDGLLAPLNTSGFTTGYFPLGIVVVPRR